MYRVKETFEYLVDDCNDFCSVHDVLEMDTDMPCPCWDGSKVPVNEEGEEESIPWGNSTIEISSNDIAIDVDTLLQLIKDSEELEALKAEGVTDWERYYEAIKELNIGYQKDAITNKELIKQYCK